MSSAFVDTTRIAVADGDDTIFVKRKMDIGTTALVRDTIFQINIRNGNADSVMVSQGAYDLALLTHNIIAWEGPAFANGNGKPVPVTPENVYRLDPDLPVVAKALARIKELNTPREDAPSPLSSTTTTAPDSPASEATS